MSSFAKEASECKVGEKASVTYCHTDKPYAMRMVYPGQYHILVHRVKVAEWIQGFLYPAVKEGERITFSSDLLEFILVVHKSLQRVS